MRISISIRLIIYFLSISILSIYIVGKFSFNKSRDALINRTFEQLISVRAEKEIRLSTFLDLRFQDLKNIAAHDDSKEILKHINASTNIDIFNHYLAKALSAQHYYHDIYFINNQQQLQSFSLYDNTNKRPHIPLDFFNKEQITNSFSPQEIFIKEFKVADNQYALLIGKEVHDKQSNTLGYIVLEVSYDAIDQIMIENNQYNGLGNSGEVYLVGADFLMRSSSRFQNNSVFRTSVETIGVKEALKGHQGQQKIDDYRGIAVLSSYKLLNIKALPWVILAEIDYSEAMISVKSVENNIMYLSIIISLFLIGIIAAVSSNITSPIRKLHAAVEDISNGKYGKTLQVKSKNEIGDLIRVFNEMTLTLQEQKESLEYQQLIRTTAVINGQEEERQRLSREIHDGLAQHILAIKLRLETVFDKQGKAREAILEETKQLFSETIAEIRNISNNLMPSVLNEFGLVVAIENLSKQMNDGNLLRFCFNNEVKNEEFGEKVSIYVYRIIQEALNNTIKHSNAKKFEISLNDQEEHLNLIIEDDGIGFDINQKKIGGNGILNIKERVNLLSGTIEIQSSPGQGVKIDIQIPF